MSIDFSMDRNDLSNFHVLSNGTGSNVPGSSSGISHGQSIQNSIWKHSPTPIPKPGTNRKVLPSKNINKSTNPYSGINNNLSTRYNPSTRSLVPIPKTQAPYHSTISMPSDEVPVPKKPKLDTGRIMNRRGSVNSLDFSKSPPSVLASTSLEVEKIFASHKTGGRTPMRRKPVRGNPSPACTSITEVIDVDSADEDLGERIVPRSESSDDLLLRDGERPGQDHFGSLSIQTILEADPPSIRHPFTLGEGKLTQLLPPPVGTHTSALKTRINAEQNGHTSNNWSQSDPIEDVDDLDQTLGMARRTRKATPLGTTEFGVNYVKDTVRHFNRGMDVHETPPEVDLHAKAQRSKVSSMKAKSKLKSQKSRERLLIPHSADTHRLEKPPRKRSDPIATSSTNFYEGKGLESNHKIILPVEKWIFGNNFIESTKDTRHGLSVGSGQVSLDVDNNGKRTLMFELDLKHDIKGVTIPKSHGDADEFPSLKFCVLNTGRSTHLFRNEEEGTEQLDVYVKFLQEHENWSTKDYERMGEVLMQSSSSAAQIVDSHARRAQWQSAEHEATRLEATVFTQPPGRRPKPRPAYSEARNFDHSGGFHSGYSPSADPWVRRSTRNISHVSRNPSRPPSPLADETILLYPPIGTGAVNVTHGDMKRLEPGEYLNDTLIELGLKLWLNMLKSSKPEVAEQVHVFSSFFYTQLNHKNIEEGYQSVRKWTSKFDLFRKKYIIIPINEHMHWYLAIMCYPERALNQQTPVPHIIPNVTTRNRLRESLSKHDTHGKPMSHERPVTSPLEISEPPSTSSKSVAGDEQEVENIVSASIRTSTYEARNIPSSPLSTIAPDSPEGMVMPHPESEVEDDQSLSCVSIKADNPSPGAAFRTFREPGTVSTAAFYAAPDVKMRSVSEEIEESDQEVDELESHDRMEIDISHSVLEPTMPDQPYIFSFDSLGARHPHALKVLSRYLDLEARDKKDLPRTISAITKQASVPTQPNYCDCGVYLLHFVERFMTNPEMFIRHIMGPAKSKKSGDLNREERELLWNHAVVAGKRESLKSTIMNLASEWKQGKEAEEKGKGKAESESSNAQAENIVIDNDSDIEVLEMTPEPSKTDKSARYRPPAPHKAQRLR